MTQPGPVAPLSGPSLSPVELGGGDGPEKLAGSVLLSKSTILDSTGRSLSEDA